MALHSLIQQQMTGGRETVRASGAVNRFTEGYFVIPQHTMRPWPSLLRSDFSSVVFSPKPPFQSAAAPCSARIIYSESVFFGEHTAFLPFVMLPCAQIKLGIMLYSSTMKPCHSALRDNIKCHVRVHVQNKITAFGRKGGGTLNSCCTLHLMYYAKGESADCCWLHC